MHSCVYTLGLCVHSYRDAHHKQTFASMSFEKNKGIFPSLYRKGLHSKRATASLLSSTPLIPKLLWDHNSSVSHFQRDHTQHSSVDHLPPGADGGAERAPALLKAFPCNVTRLQLSVSPQRGLQMRIISLFSFPASEASLLLAVEKPSFLESSRFLLKIEIPVTEADPDQALPFCLDLHPSLGNSPSWKSLGYKYSLQNSLCDISPFTA